MTVTELIEALNGLIEDGEATGDTVVLFAHQPHYPLQCGVGGPVVLSEDDEEISNLESHLEMADYWDSTTEMADAMSRLQRLKKSRVSYVYLHETSLPWDESPYAPSGAFGD